MARNADDLLADLDQLGSEEQVPVSKSKKTTSKLPPPTSSVTDTTVEDDPLADLQAQLAARPAVASRPATPHLSSSTTSTATTKRADHTPASSGPPSGRTSEEQSRRNVGPVRTSGEGRSYHQGTSADTGSTPTATESKTPATQASAGGGWWGSMFSAASAAVKQAETLAKEISGNEEVQKWADQARGNLSNLQSFSTDLRSRALPTFNSLISHIAPPISAHERLQIHITHDIQNYPSLDPLIYSTFSRVMSQVEGGDLIVIQRGSENRSRAGDNVGYRGGVLGSGNGWSDGPWWREDTAKRNLGVVPGLKEGSRLARVSAEAYAKEFLDARGGLEEVSKRASQAISESNPTRSSDIFLSLQAISHGRDGDLFAADARSTSTSEKEQEREQENAEDTFVTFAIYLHDPLHQLSFSTLSQPIPEQWTTWLDASPAAGEVLPESINEIIAAGGVDPREWVSEWVEEVLSLGVGVVAQNYVARRMGVGEGRIGRAKRRAEEDSAAGEAARAI